MVPAAAEAFAFDTNFACFLGFQQIQSNATEPGEVLGPVALANAAVVFAEVDIQRPMQAVFNTPVASDVIQQFGWIVGGQTAVVWFDPFLGPVIVPMRAVNHAGLWRPCHSSL